MNTSIVFQLKKRAVATAKAWGGLSALLLATSALLCPLAHAQVLGENNVKLEEPTLISVGWNKFENELSDNPPGQGGGKRIFADKKKPTDPTTYNIVKVEAKVTYASPTTKVFFKLFDVDDPTTDEFPADQNGKSGQDNRTNSGSFQLKRTQATVVDGIASVELVVNRNPGNNFRVAAIIDTPKNQASLGSLTVAYTEGGTNEKYVAPNDDQITDFEGKVTPMLTVWRRLHLELDAMEKPVGNQNKVVGQITNISRSDNGSYTALIDQDLIESQQVRAGATGDLSKNMDNTNPDAPNTPLGLGRFQGGEIKIGSGTDARDTNNLLGNGINKVVTVNGAKFQIFFELSKEGKPTQSGNVATFSKIGTSTVFVIETTSENKLLTGLDDDYSGGDLSVGGEVFVVNSNTSNSVSVNNINISLPFVLSDDDAEYTPELPHIGTTAEEKYAQVFILPIIDGGDGCDDGINCANNRINIPFVRNINSIKGMSDVFGVIDSDRHRADDFWVVSLMTVFQGGTDPTSNEVKRGDNDSNNEGPSLAWATGVGGKGAHWAYQDVIHEFRSLNSEKDTWVHELGHCLGCEDRYKRGDRNDLGVGKGGIMEYNSSPIFVPADINIIRSRVVSPGG